MASVSGTITVGEADTARREIARRQALSSVGEYWLLILLVVAFGAVGAIALRGPGMAIGVALAFIVYWAIAARLVTSRNRKRAMQLGMPVDMPVELTTAADRFSYRVGDIQTIAKWPAVSELAMTQGYWVFLIYSSPIFAPRRFFTDPDAERDFVRESLACMSDEARRRSTAARAFAGLS